MHKFRIPRLVIAAAVAILSACAIGCLCFFQVRVTDNNLSPQLQNGDRVMINRLTPLDRGQIVVYINPLSSSKFSYGLGKCLALAGDTLRLFMKDVTSNSHSKHNYAWHDIIVPSKNTPVKVTRWNKKLLRFERAEGGSNRVPVIEASLDDPMLRNYFVGDNFKEDYRRLNAFVRQHGINIPPLVNAYMSLSPTMRMCGTAINHEFGEVEESSIFFNIDEITDEKKNRHIRTYKKNNE